MTFYETVKQIGLPVAYGYHSEEQRLPYLCILGAGQVSFRADNIDYVKHDQYTLEYYYKRKDPEQEAVIESLLSDNGYLYSKSEDVYIDSEDVFVIYYEVI